MQDFWDQIDWADMVQKIVFAIVILVITWIVARVVYRSRIVIVLSPRSSKSVLATVVYVNVAELCSAVLCLGCRRRSALARE